VDNKKLIHRANVGVALHWQRDVLKVKSGSIEKSNQIARSLEELEKSRIKSDG
jgi:hypothetical protein